MSLLRDIQDAAIRDETSVSMLLRQCLVLGARLRHDPLRAWAELELSGYPDDAPLPPFRPKIQTQVLGDLSGPAGGGLRNAELAPSSLPPDWEDWHDRLFTAEVRLGVPEIEGLMSSDQATAQIPWPTDVVAALAEEFYDYMTLMRARQIVPITVFVGALNGIRQRVLHFALEIESENPDAGEAPPDTDPIPQPRITQIFNQTFLGAQTTIAAGSGDVSATFNLTRIEAGLEGLGIGREDARALLTALAADGTEPGDPPGPETLTWLERLERGAISLGEGITVQAAIAVISNLLGLS